MCWEDLRRIQCNVSRRIGYSIEKNKATLNLLSPKLLSTYAIQCDWVTLLRFQPRPTAFCLLPTVAQSMLLTVQQASLQMNTLIQMIDVHAFCDLLLSTHKPMSKAKTEILLSRHGILEPQRSWRELSYLQFQHFLEFPKDGKSLETKQSTRSTDVAKASAAEPSSSSVKVTLLCSRRSKMPELKRKKTSVRPSPHDFCDAWDIIGHHGTSKRDSEQYESSMK